MAEKCSFLQKWSQVIHFTKMNILWLIFTSHFGTSSCRLSNSAQRSASTAMPTCHHGPSERCHNQNPTWIRPQTDPKAIIESCWVCCPWYYWWDEDTGRQTTKTRHTSWTPARTECLLDWLEENPADCQKLFSDSTKDAKDEGRRKRVSKGMKSEFHKIIAMFVFSADVDAIVWADFTVNPRNYTKSVDNYLAR